MAVDGLGDLSYECLTSPKVCQALVSRRTVKLSLHEQPSTPPPSASKPSRAPLGHTGSYPEDRGDEDDDALVDSSLSPDEVIFLVANDAPGPLVDISDDVEDEGVDGFGHEISRSGPAAILEPFGPQFATSYWPRTLDDGDSA
jgi:hypothetical protein